MIESYTWLSAVLAILAVADAGGRKLYTWLFETPCSRCGKFVEDCTCHQNKS